MEEQADSELVSAEPARLIELLTTYLKSDDIDRIVQAYRFSEEAHRGQYRTSGAHYISHPLAVAETLASWCLDTQAISAALLHDVMEDTHITKAQIVAHFGETIADLVDGVSKLGRIENQSWEEAQADSLRKMLLAMAHDVRVILVKLADRLHNMHTLEAIRPDKRRRIAQETMDIYAPIANRLGLNAIYQELQSLAFQHLYPMRYRVLEKALRLARGNRREVVDKTMEALRKRLSECHVQAEVLGREKHLFSIYRKMRDKHLTFSQVLDLYGFRVIVSDNPACYLALGALHGLYKPIPGKFKDYIAIPKANGYQSLHTMLIGSYGTPVEIQIRTIDMHYVAESGVASHWLYKDVQTLSELQRTTHEWLQSLIELQSASKDSTEFLEHVKIDLFPDEVYVFTPKGRIMSLPRGATPVDFAYAVHTDIGNRCVACRINHESMPLRSELKNGDCAEIITASHAIPNPAWLTYVRTGKARSQIRTFLKTRQSEESAALGERLLNQALHNLNLRLSDIDDELWEAFLKESDVKTKQQTLTDIGLGLRLSAMVARGLNACRGRRNEVTSLTAQFDLPKVMDRDRPGTFFIQGTEGGAVSFAKCCRPIPGDPIIGIIRKGQGLTVHTHDCPVMIRRRGDRHDWVDVDWEPGIQGTFEVGLSIVTENCKGVLARIAAVIAEEGANIADVRMDDNGDRSKTTTLYFSVQVTNRRHLASILRRVRRIVEVVRIHRTRERNSVEKVKNP